MLLLPPARVSVYICVSFEADGCVGESDSAEIHAVYCFWLRVYVLSGIGVRGFLGESRVRPLCTCICIEVLTG